MKNDYEILRRYPAATIADAAFQSGVSVRALPSVLRPLNSVSRIVGPATTVRCNNDLVAVLEGLMRAEKGDILLIDNDGFTGAGCVGDVIVSEAVRKELSGFVVYGSIRDSRQIAAMELPMFCAGLCPVGPLKLPDEEQRIGRVEITLDIEGVLVDPGDIIVGDADGVIVLEPRDLQGIISKAEEIERKEQDLTRRIEAGSSLTDIFGIEAYLEKRKTDSGYSFNRHLAEQRETI